MNKKIFLITGLLFVSLICSVFIIAFILTNLRDTESNPFENYELLADSCQDKSCRYFFLCNENMEEFSDCRVYDAGNKYGVLIKNKKGEIFQKEIAKPDQKKVAETVARCKGSLEILEKKECVDEQARAKVKVSTEGECPVSSFTVKIDGERRIAEFEEKGGFFYISINKCGEISEIVAISKEGIPIR